MNRRKFLLGAAAAQLVASFTPGSASAAARTRHKVRQGVMGTVWAGSNLTFEQQCQTLARIGYVSRDLPTEAQALIMKNYGLTPGMMVGTGTNFRDGAVRKEMHDVFEKATREGIDMCARVACRNLIALPGERRGMSRAECAENTISYFNRVKSYAEQKGVTLCMEITNSKVVADQRTDHAFDHFAWGLDVCKRVDSPNVKIVYDIYHMAVADGDVTRTMRDNIDWICHMHAAGVPGRLEIDETQELNYRFIANAIADSGYTGIVAHEWRPGPGRETVASLEKCFRILDV